MIALLVFLLSASVASAAAPATAWEKYYGGSGYEEGRAVWQTSDCGFIVVGVAPDAASTYDNLQMIKLDWQGSVQWTKLFASNGRGWSVRQTSDGGFIATGSDSNSLYLVKVDKDGNKLWEKTYQYEGHQTIGYAVQQTSDGGYVISGDTCTDDVTNWQVYLLKTDASGEKSWEKIFGGNDGADHCYSVWQTSDGGYILGGLEGSTAPANNPKPLLIKTDGSGNQEWYKLYQGEDQFDNFKGEVCGVQQTRDGGYIYAGQHSNKAYLLKTDSGGNKQWSKDYAGTGFNSVQQAWDGGYVLAGYSQDTEGMDSALVLRTDGSGNQQWVRTYGGKGKAEAYDVIQIGNGSFIVAGWTKAGADTETDVYLFQIGKDMTPVPDSKVASDNIPTVWDAGKAYTVYVTLTNEGTMPWTFQDKTVMGYSHDASKFGVANQTIPVGAVIRPGQSYRFEFTMTAPAQNGTYNPRIQMAWEDRQMFGAVLNKTIKVVNGTPEASAQPSAATQAATATTIASAAPTAAATQAATATIGPSATAAPTRNSSGGLCAAMLLPMLLVGLVTAIASLRGRTGKK